MKEININKNPIYLYLAKTLEFAESYSSYPREAPILFFVDNKGYYLGIQYDHNHIGFVSNDRYFNQHDVELLIKCSDKEYNMNNYIEMWYSVHTNG